MGGDTTVGSGEEEKGERRMKSDGTAETMDGMDEPGGCERICGRIWIGNFREWRKDVRRWINLQRLSC
jgi:hypothetical protein